MKLTGRRRSPLGLSLVSFLVLLSAATACRDKKDESSAPDAGAPVVASAAVSVPAAVVAAAEPAARPADDERDDVSDAGADGSTDAGPRKRRRLVGLAEAGAPETVAAPPPPVEAPAASGRGKRPPSPMGNDGVYGAGSGAPGPSLQKTPLPSDDPWKSPPTPSR